MPSSGTFYGMADKVRKDPMGPATMGLLKNNASVLRSMLQREHIVSTGEHNAREVPRVVRRISGTTVSPSSSDITAVSNGTTGKYVLTLAASRFDANWMTCQINPCGADVANKPYLVGYQVVSATSIEVYFKQLTSTLGNELDPNTWANTNIDFDIAIHSEPLTVGSWGTALPAASVVGDPLKPTRWNALVQNSADLNKNFTAAHTSAGLHHVREVASYSGMFRYDGATVAKTAGDASGISVSRTSTGIYAVTSSTALSTQTHVFVSPDHARLNGGSSSALYRAHVLQSSTTAFTVYVYEFNRTNSTWNRADADFWLAFHVGY